MGFLLGSPFMLTKTTIRSNIYNINTTKEKDKMKKYLSALFVLVATLLVLASTAFAATDYTITNIRLTDLKGNSIEYTEGSCMVNVTVTKNNDVADG